MLGDIANDYRSAIDHLAWALVSRGRTPPALLTDDQFSSPPHELLAREELWAWFASRAIASRSR